MIDPLRLCFYPVFGYILSTHKKINLRIGTYTSINKQDLEFLHFFKQKKKLQLHEGKKEVE